MASQLHPTRAREDLVQQGAMAVVEAVRHFDPERGIRLSSYATWQPDHVAGPSAARHAR